MSKDYIRPMPKRWWTTRPGWAKFMLREWTALPVAIYCGVLIAMAAAARSEASWQGFCDWLETPLSMILHVIVLAFALLHTVTWFAAAPKAIRVFRGDEQVPEALVAGGHFAAWVVVSAGFALLVVGL